jgi:hypothetical protein
LATAREAEVNEPGKIEGIDIERVSAWMADHTPLTLPLAFKLIAGGRSNMTFMVTDAAGQRFVLRRPAVSPQCRDSFSLQSPSWRDDPEQVYHRQLLV